MNGSKKRDSFILQAGILAAAGFISRIIGLLYVSPVTRIIGHVGLGRTGIISRRTITML